jgi:hypothetical protein
MPDTRALTKSEILDQLERLNRTPFQDWAAEIIGALPDAKAMRAYFAKYPDRAAQTLTQAARLAGYSEKTEINQTNIYAIINGASDAELMARLTKALETLGAAQPTAKTIEHERVQQPTRTTE